MFIAALMPLPRLCRYSRVDRQQVGKGQQSLAIYDTGNAPGDFSHRRSFVTVIRDADSEVIQLRLPRSQQDSGMKEKLRSAFAAWSAWYTREIRRRDSNRIWDR